MSFTLIFTSVSESMKIGFLSLLIEMLIYIDRCIITHIIDLLESTWIDWRSLIDAERMNNTVVLDDIFVIFVTIAIAGFVVWAKRIHIITDSKVLGQSLIKLRLQKFEKRRFYTLFSEKAVAVLPVILFLCK